MSAVEKERISSVQELVTNVMLGESVSINNVQERYYFIDNRFYKNRRTLLKTAEEYKEKEIYQLINDASSVAFIGDSITEGTKNDYHPWYEPMMQDFADKDIINISKGSYTIKMILDDYVNIPPMEYHQSAL